MGEGQAGRDWVKRGIAGGVLAFALISAAFMQGWLVPLDVAADKALREPFGEWSDAGGTYDYVVIRHDPVPGNATGNATASGNWTEPKGRVDFDEAMFGDEGTGNSTCQRADTLQSDQPRALAERRYDGPSRTLRCSGNFTLTVAPGGYWVDPPWGGYASYFGSESAAFALLTATALLLAAIGSWRTALVALAVGALGGSLVDPMKDYFAAFGELHYGGIEHMADRYPSGHTIGGTMQFGLFLILGAVAFQRAGLVRNPRLMRHAVTAWVAIAVACGIDRVVTHAHILSDVLAGWAFGLAFVSAAVWVDRRWHESLSSKEAPVPSDVAV